ncbi:MAG TPA: FAD-binding protein, partial [Acidimicrobiales bacterium]|nr:FAD-binding protein [Acidimicrobiales bacterium]
TQWSVGGDPDPSAREVRAPSGVVRHEPAEMIVRVRAGTTVAELDAVLADGGQTIALDPVDPQQATVGGVLAVGHSGLRRLGWGPVRDTLLEARFVSAEGRLIRAGGPVVKNVTGFDLCRLLVGSLGTIGLLAEVVLRVRPRPPVSIWLRGAGQDPDRLRDRLFRPSSILWDGTSCWVLLEGHPADVDAEVAAVGSGFEPVEQPPALPHAGRLSVTPSAIRELVTTLAPGTFVAEIGVGIVHAATPPPPRRVGPERAAIERRIKTNFDPTGRLNPGRTVA